MGGRVPCVTVGHPVGRRLLHLGRSAIGKPAAGAACSDQAVPLRSLSWRQESVLSCRCPEQQGR